MQYLQTLQTSIISINGWQVFVLVTVFKVFRFENCIFRQLSCGMLERYCRTLLVTCTLIPKACSITLRFFSVVQWFSILQLCNKLAVGWEWMNENFMPNHIAFLFPFNELIYAICSYIYVCWFLIIIITVILLSFFAVILLLIFEEIR